MGYRSCGGATIYCFNSQCHIECNQDTGCPDNIYTNQPTSPSRQPTERPSVGPTFQPSYNPTLNPSFMPSFQPSQTSLIKPSPGPTFDPSINPTFDPTSKATTSEPTSDPSIEPTFDPIEIFGIYTSTFMPIQESIFEDFGRDQNSNTDDGLFGFTTFTDLDWWHYLVFAFVLFLVIITIIFAFYKRNIHRKQIKITNEMNTDKSPDKTDDNLLEKTENIELAKQNDTENESGTEKEESLFDTVDNGQTKGMTNGMTTKDTNAGNEGEAEGFNGYEQIEEILKSIYHQDYEEYLMKFKNEMINDKVLLDDDKFREKFPNDHEFWTKLIPQQGARFAFFVKIDGNV